jgi:isopropylmalate/homocitrate/citramalate synthase
MIHFYLFLLSVVETFISDDRVSIVRVALTSEMKTTDGDGDLFSWMVAIVPVTRI